MTHLLAKPDSRNIGVCHRVGLRKCALVALRTYTPIANCLLPSSNIPNAISQSPNPKTHQPNPRLRFPSTRIFGHTHLTSPRLAADSLESVSIRGWWRVRDQHIQGRNVPEFFRVANRIRCCPVHDWNTRDPPAGGVRCLPFGCGRSEQLSWSASTAPVLA